MVGHTCSAGVRSRLLFEDVLKLWSALAGLPKTRSGKIMRQVLRKIAVKEEEQLGKLQRLQTFL